MTDTLKGVVKWFNDAKGFGFIEHTSGRDVFVHYSVIESEGFRTLKDGEEVDYEIKEGPKGLQASRVARKLAALGDQATRMGVQATTSSGSDEAESSDDSEPDAMPAAMMAGTSGQDSDSGDSDSEGHQG